VSGQLHAWTVLPTGKEPPIPIGQEVGWTTELVWTTWAPGHTATGRIRSIEKSNDLMGNRTRYLPAYSIVPQPTTLITYEV
jgi:hypothetical protein